MTAFSRREFGKIVIAGVPLATAFRPTGLFAAGQVTFGVSTSSFRDLPRVPGFNNLDDVIRALHTVGTTRVELALANVEPAPPSTAPFLGGTPAYPARVVFTPEQIAATNAFYREGLRGWRRDTTIGYFDEMRGRLTAAGLDVHACALSYDASFTDAEIDATFQQIKALGATTVSSPLTMAMAVRLVPFAERHKVSVAIHNQVDGNAAGLIATPHLREALTLSPAFTLKLDIGNLAASNGDAVATLREHQARVSHVLVKDRLRNGGASQHFGEGDTPIPGVLNLLKASASSIPAVVEYDYVGLHSSVDEVKAAVAYMARAIT